LPRPASNATPRPKAIPASVAFVCASLKLEVVEMPPPETFSFKPKATYGPALKYTGPAYTLNKTGTSK